jgi:hypothetical protein
MPDEHSSNVDESQWVQRFLHSGLKLFYDEPLIKFYLNGMQSWGCMRPKVNKIKYV